MKGESTQAGKVGRITGMFLRKINQYRGSSESPFKWIRGTISFDSDMHYDRDPPTFQDICDRESITFADAETKLRNIQKRARLYFIIAALYALVIFLLQITSDESHLVLMTLELLISVMFVSWAVRLSFWAFQTRYGLERPGEPLPLFDVYLKNPEYWF